MKPKMKRSTLYVVRCIKTMPRTCRWARKGEYFTSHGDGAKKLDKARVYKAGSDDFPWDDWYSWGCPGEYFEAVPVKFIIALA